MHLLWCVTPGKMTGRLYTAAKTMQQDQHHKGLRDKIYTTAERIVPIAEIRIYLCMEYHAIKLKVLRTS